MSLVNLSHTNLPLANLSPANLSPANLSHVDMPPVDLSPANLSPADLSPANLSPVNLPPANCPLSTCLYAWSPLCLSELPPCPLSTRPSVRPTHCDCSVCCPPAQMNASESTHLSVNLYIIQPA